MHKPFSGNSTTHGPKLTPLEQAWYGPPTWAKLLPQGQPVEQQTPFGIRAVTVSDLSFPVLSLKGWGLRVYDSAEGLTRWGESTLKERTYADITLVDASLREFRVTDAREIGSAGGTPRWVPFVDHWIRVELDLRRVGDVTLGELKERVVSAFETGPDYWDAFASIEELVASVRATDSFERLLDAIPTSRDA